MNLIFYILQKAHLSCNYSYKGRNRGILVKKIIIYGTGSLADEFLACINSKNFEIIGFIDLYKDEFKDYKKINLKSLDEFVFDYLICATSFVDDFNQILEIKNINQNKIIYLHPYLTIYNQELDLKRKISKLRNTNISNLVLGLSYARDGLRDEFLSNHTVNLSLGSQDLISDFKLLNYLKEQNILNNINHLILGVGYYAFEHELNKMFFSKYELRYCDLFDIEQDPEYYKFLKKHCFKYLDEELLNIIEAYKFEKIRTNPDKSNFIKNAMEMSEKHNRMSYPKSRIKNELSFLKIIDICKEFNIKLTALASH